MTMNDQTSNKLVGKKECAECIGIKVRTLEKYVAEGRIPVIKISQKCVRFHMGDVLAALRSLAA